MANEDDFLSRWSRRKRRVAKEQAEPQSEAEPPKITEPEPEPETEEEEAELLARLNLPVPEGLKEGDDFSGFMQAGVPEFLRKRALRVLWRSNPVLANLDGLNDYDEDFTSPELTQKVLATGYKVGRGFVSQMVEKNTDEQADQPPDTPAAKEPKPSEAPVAQKENSEAERTVAYNELDELPARPRRMRFET